MKVLYINTVCGIGSTGRIASDMLSFVKSQGGEGIIAYGVDDAQRVDENEAYLIGGKRDYYFHNIMSRLTDREGCFSKKATRRLINFIETYNPDIIHLHNLHGHYINYKILFDYLAEKNIKIIWTLHDCWPITGHCTYFTYNKCNAWTNTCSNCKHFNLYPTSWFLSQAQKNLADKKSLFTSPKNMTIVTPSNWLANIVKHSFLSKYPVKVINNGIDLDIFKPTTSNFREKFQINTKKIILGVASEWDERKGIRDFFKLSGMLDDSYVIVLVGLSKGQASSLSDTLKDFTLNENYDNKFFSYVPVMKTEHKVSKLIAITRTNSVEQLAEIYSAADVFVNTTYEDNFPTVNLEALACGTPVVTYDTGGSPEAIDESCGVVCSQGNLSELVKCIDKALRIPQENIIKRAELYSKTSRFEDYYKLYFGT